MRVVRILALALAAASLAVPASAVTIDWVTVGDPGNAGDPQESCTGCGPGTSFGSVDYTYRISKYEVTNAQYAEFLNAVDPTGLNTLGLYSGFTGSSINFVAGNANGSKYVVQSGFAGKPVNFVTFYDSLRFANWLHNTNGLGGAWQHRDGGVHAAGRDGGSEQRPDGDPQRRRQVLPDQ